MEPWQRAMIGGAALLLLGVLSLLVLGSVQTSRSSVGPPPRLPIGPSPRIAAVPTDPLPIGNEVANHTYQGEEYVLVEYGDRIAVFQGSGAPAQRSLAEDVLRSYAWGRAIGDFNAGELTGVAEKVQALDYSVSDARDFSRDVLGIIEELEYMEAGGVTAMDIVRETLPGVGEAESLIRSLHGHLNDFGEDAAALSRAAERIPGLQPSSNSGDEMDALLRDAAAAAQDLENTVRSVNGSLSVVEEAAGDVKKAILKASVNPAFRDTLRDFAGMALQLESGLSDLSDLLAGCETELVSLRGRIEHTSASANTDFQTDVGRLLARPHDTEWPPADQERRPAGPAQVTAEEPRPPTPAPEYQPFKLEWETSVSNVETDESFTLSVRMYDIQEAGEHGGISVSFPPLTQSGGSTGDYSSRVADIETLEYTTGLSNVTFHQPETTIYHRENDRQFPADYLLVESDDATWSRSDDRTLRLRITPKRGGEFLIQIRGWLCSEGYTDCSRQPSSGPIEDQQGWVVEQVIIGVS